MIIRPTVMVRGKDLKPADVLVGKAGGLSAIAAVRRTYVITEHGFLMIDPEMEYEILEEA